MWDSKSLSETTPERNPGRNSCRNFVKNWNPGILILTLFTASCTRGYPAIEGTNATQDSQLEVAGDIPSPLGSWRAFSLASKTSSANCPIHRSFFHQLWRRSFSLLSQQCGLWRCLYSFRYGHVDVIFKFAVQKCGLQIELVNIPPTVGY